MSRDGFGAGAGEEKYTVDLVLVQVPPVVDDLLVQLGGGVGDVYPTMVPVGGPGGGDVAVAELVEGVAFPLQGLAAVHRQLHHPTGGVGEGGDGSSEGATGADLRELMRITDQHHLGSGGGGVVDDGGEVAGGGHPRLIHHQHGVGGEGGWGGEEPGDRLRDDPGPGFEFAGGPGRWGEPDHVPAGVLVDVVHGAERERLARPGPPDQHLDPTGPGQGPDRVRLFDSERRAGRDRLVDQGCRWGSDRTVVGAEVIDEPLLDTQQPS